jgi:GH15 family glucan-1,4-alpha-glucosidase
VPCPPSENDAEQLLQGTVKFWQDWLSGCTYHGRWWDQVQRSALALKLLTFETTGAIIAAPTTSLPEVIGGARNWDYRYTRIRDAAFTVYGFLRIGFRDEAAAFMRWIEDYASKHVRPKAPGAAYDVWVKIRNRLEWICENWQRPDAGIWEMRNRQEHFVYSKVARSCPAR